MCITPKTELTLEYRSLTGPEFNQAVSGQYLGEGRVVPHWLKSPRLKYFLPRSVLQRGPDQRQLFLCLVRDAEQSGVRQAVGILEFEVSPYNPGEVWLKYITVHPDYQRRGIARRLLDMAVTDLQHQPRKVARSRPSAEGAVRIKNYIDRLFDSQDIAWSQGDTA